MVRALIPEGAETPVRPDWNDCPDCKAAPYVTARLVLGQNVGERESFCRPHAEEVDAKRMFAVGSARRVST